MRISTLTKKFALVGICAALLLAMIPYATMGASKEPPDFQYTLEGYPYEGGIVGIHQCCNPTLPPEDGCQLYSDPCEFNGGALDGEEAVHVYGVLTKTGAKQEGVLDFDTYIPLGYPFDSLTGKDLEGEGDWYPPQGQPGSVYWEVYQGRDLEFTSITAFTAYIRVKEAKPKNPNSGPNNP